MAEDRQADSGGESDQYQERERERVFDLTQRAFTRAEVEEASAALAAHLAAHPEDERHDLAHGLRVSAACLAEREDQARWLGLTEEEVEQREQLLKQTRVVVDPVRDPDCLARLDQAQEALQCWLAGYPDDVAVRSQLQGLTGSKALARELLSALRELDSGAAGP